MILLWQSRLETKPRIQGTPNVVCYRGRARFHNSKALTEYRDKWEEHINTFSPVEHTTRKTDRYKVVVTFGLRNDLEKIDVDKLQRAIGDILTINRVVWDDSNIVKWEAEKVTVKIPYCEVSVYRI